MTAGNFERLVLAKPFFDPKGLIVAVRDGRPVGFVHVGFGPNASGDGLDRQVAAVAQLMVAPDGDAEATAAELLGHAEAYARGAGAVRILGGQAPPVRPYYWGLYGGADMSGVLESDRFLLETLQAAGYQLQRRRLILQRTLTGFRPPVDRALLQLRRQCKLEQVADPRPRSWWEAWLTTHMERTQYVLRRSADEPPCAQALFWDMEPLATDWGVYARGLMELYVAPAGRRQGLATFLLGEAMKQMRALGVRLVEAHVDQQDEPARGLLAKLGFETIEHGLVLAKDL